MLEYQEEFEAWFLKLDSDFTYEELSKVINEYRKTSHYFYTTTKALHKQFCKIKELELELLDAQARQ